MPTLPSVDYSIARADWLEPSVQTTDAAGFALTANRAVKLRVFVRVPAANSPAPKVMLRATDAAGNPLGTEQQLPGPARVGTAVSPGSLDTAFIFAVPKAWVQPGLRIHLSLDTSTVAQDPVTSNNELTLSPAVNPPLVLYVTVVPIQTAVEGTAVLPRQNEGPAATVEAFRSLYMSSFPVSDVKVRVLPVHPSPIASMALQWGAMVGEITRMAVVDGAGHTEGFWVGLAPNAAAALGVVGQGYTNGSVFVAIGPSDPLGTGWKGTFRHEFGHNLGWGHADCVKNDASGQQWGYNSDIGTMVDPAITNHIMSYCTPGWFPLANYQELYRRIRDNAYARPPANPADWK